MHEYASDNVFVDYITPSGLRVLLISTLAVFDMGVKYRFASFVSKVLCKVCRAAKFGGTTFPGKIACKLYPDALKEAASGYKIIMVTGTNGKTTTAHIIGQILEGNGVKYIANKSGANLIGGIATTFLNLNNQSKKTSAKLA